MSLKAIEQVENHLKQFPKYEATLKSIKQLYHDRYFSLSDLIASGTISQNTFLNTSILLRANSLNLFSLNFMKPS